MGRPRKSPQEKKREGNPSKRKAGKELRVALAPDGKPPKGMSKKEACYWNLYAPYMVENELLTDLNRTDLARLCYFEHQLDEIHKMLSGSLSLLQEKKNYHGEVVDLVEGVYSKLSRNYTAMIRTIKADMRIRTDKMKDVVPKPPASKFDGLVGGNGNGG
jgi:hypothetical protein